MSICVCEYIYANAIVAHETNRRECQISSGAEYRVECVSGASMWWGGSSMWREGGGIISFPATRTGRWKVDVGRSMLYVRR